MRGDDKTSKMGARRLAIFGAGGHAKVVADAVRRASHFDLVGFIDDTSPDRRGEQFCEAPVLGGRECLPALLGGGAELILAFGDNAARLAVAAQMRALGFRFAAVVHPQAVVAADVAVGEGSFIAAGAVINPGTIIGDHVIVNTGAVVEHDCRLGEGVHLSPRACLAGRASVGRAAWLGVGVVVRDGVVIGEGAVIGMGSVVLHDIPSDVVAYGTPARVVRELAKDRN